MALICALALYPLALLYSLLYTAYVSGCSASTNGTLLTVNANALLFNAAGLEGHAVLLATVAAYDARAAVDCARLNGAGVANFLNDELAIAEARAQQRSADDSIDLLSRCLDPLSFNLSALPAAAAANSSSSPLLLQLPSPFIVLSVEVAGDCSSSGGADWAGELLLPVFNCTALPSCHASPHCASGPSPAAIRAATFDSGCMTEYALHSSLLLYAVALLVFVCHNVSRTLIVRAVVRLCWRALCPFGLTALVHCGEDGALDGQSSERLAYIIQDTVVAYRRQTLCLFVSGLLAHAPYIVVLAALLFVEKGVATPQLQ